MTCFWSPETKNQHVEFSAEIPSGNKGLHGK